MKNKTLALLIENYKPILASFSLAFILWFVVTTNKEYTTKIVIPFSIQRVAEDKIIANEIPHKVILEVKGKGRALVSLNFLEKDFSLVLPELTGPTTLYLADYINSINIPSDLGIEIIDIVEPKTIELEIDDFMETRKPVRICQSVSPAPGYIIMRTASNMDSVSVSGPSRFIRDLAFVDTDSIIYNDVKYPFEVTVDLQVPESDKINIEPHQARVSYFVEQLVERNIYNIPIRILRVPDAFQAQAEPETILLRVKGGQSIVSELKPTDISVIFDYSKNFKDGVTEYPMQIETPLGVSWIEASPQKFRLKLVKKE